LPGGFETFAKSPIGPSKRRGSGHESLGLRPDSSVGEPPTKCLDFAWFDLQLRDLHGDKMVHWAAR
jgi:hypothetical protein